MKILEAYYDPKIRNDLKRYLYAEGRKLSEIDKLYTQFGVYLSRLKGIPFYQTLMDSPTEDEFCRNLDLLFDHMWVNHMGYTDMPTYFRRYLSYLHSASALNPELRIEGLQPPEDIFCVPGSDVTDFAKPYIQNGKLKIIANPLLIKRLLPFKKDWPKGRDQAISMAKIFYGPLLPATTDADWSELISDLLAPKKQYKAKATARNVEISYPDGRKVVVGGTQAMEIVVNDIGISKLSSFPVLHKGERILTRTPNPRLLSSYKQLDGGYWLNQRGTVGDKVKTLRMLTSHFRLPYTVLLTNAELTPDPINS